MHSCFFNNSSKRDTYECTMEELTTRRFEAIAVDVLVIVAVIARSVLVEVHVNSATVLVLHKW